MGARSLSSDKMRKTMRMAWELHRFVAERPKGANFMASGVSVIPTSMRRFKLEKTLQQLPRKVGTFLLEKYSSEVEGIRSR